MAIPFASIVPMTETNDTIAGNNELAEIRRIENELNRWTTSAI